AITPEGKSLITHVRDEDSRDEKLLRHDHLIVWDVPSREERLRILPESPEGKGVHIQTRALAPDGKSLAIAVRFFDPPGGKKSRSDVQSQLLLWDLAKPELKTILRSNDDIGALAFSPN